MSPRINVAPKSAPEKEMTWRAGARARGEGGCSAEQDKTNILHLGGTLSKFERSTACSAIENVDVTKNMQITSDWAIRRYSCNSQSGIPATKAKTLLILLPPLAEPLVVDLKIHNHVTALGGKVGNWSLSL